MPEPIRSVLLVCTGNTCRSPMCEALLTKRLAEEGVDCVVESAGLGAAEGVPATREAADAVRESGADLSAFRSQPLTAELVETADVILTMTTGQLDFLRLRHPAAAPKARTLLEYAHGQDAVNQDIEDPLDQGAEAYCAAAQRMRLAVEIILNKLRQAL